MSKFQVIIIGVFGFFLVLAVIVFSKYQGSGQNSAKILIWGTVSTQDFQDILSKIPTLVSSKTLEISYEYKDPKNIDEAFVESLAAGGGPDLIILPQDKIEKEKNKLTIIPYSSYSQGNFKSSFISGAEIYLDQQGIIALPIIVDPLVMYWNRSVFTNANLTQPPKYWDEFYNLAQAISQKDNALNILRSSVALGEFSNIANSKEIISNLMMQAGTPIVDTSSGRALSVLSSNPNPNLYPILPAESAVDFYTQFSNPSKPFYSWNRSLPDSQSYFLSNSLGLYFGFASELFNIQNKNPNLDFDVALVPSARDSGTQANVSFARFYGLAISRGSKNPSAALQAANIFSSSEGVSAINQVLNLPPVRRDLLGAEQAIGYKDVFYKSAIRSKAWLDPDPAQSDAIFKEMIESITSGKDRVSMAVARASKEIGDLLPK